MINKKKIKKTLKEAMTPQDVMVIQKIQSINPQLAGTLTRIAGQGGSIRDAAGKMVSYLSNIGQPAIPELQQLAASPSPQQAASMQPQVPAPMQTTGPVNKPSIQSLRTNIGARKAPTPVPPKAKPSISALRPSMQQPKSPQAAKNPASQPQLPQVSKISDPDMKKSFEPGAFAGTMAPGQIPPTNPPSEDPNSTADLGQGNPNRASQNQGQAPLPATGILPQDETRDRMANQHYHKYKNDPKYKAWFQKQPMEYQMQASRPLKKTAQQIQQVKQAANKAFRKESAYSGRKNMTKKAQLKEGVRKAYLKERKNRETKKVLKEEIRIQAEAANTAIALLEVMPNVWQGLKSAGTAAMQKMGMGGMMGGGQDKMASQRDQQVKQIVGAIEKSLKSASSERQKFNSQVLKSAQMMTSYHTSVMRAFGLYKKYEDVLGPTGMQVNRQINDVLEALEEDLMSEISQIESMLQNLGSKDKTLDAKMKSHKEKAALKREKEAEMTPQMRSSFGVTGQKMPAKTTMGNIRPRPTPKSGEDKGDTSASRVKQADAKLMKGHEAEMADIKQSYDELSKELVKRALKASSKEEKRNAMQQLMDLAKSRKEREKELETKLGGAGIRK